jgi:predicted RNA-binding protein YlqC (UPF0109 family)
MKSKVASRIDQFYADLFLSIARGMITRPDDLEAAVSAMPRNLTAEVLALPRYFVTAQCHAQDHGILTGGQAKTVLAFKVILRAAATKRGEFCDLILDEPFGQKQQLIPTPLDSNWDRDDEVQDLIADVADACWTGPVDAIARSEGGRTLVRLKSVNGIPEEEFFALQTLMKGWGRGQGRTIVLEMPK